MEIPVTINNSSFLVVLAFAITILKQVFLFPGCVITH